VEQRWQALPVGGQLMLEWPAQRRITAPAGRGRPKERVAGRRRR
jgi:hypothetical protein